MAAFSSDLYTLEVAAAADMSQSPNLHDYGGPVQVISAKVTLTDATADADTINICYLPAGARVIPGLSKAQCGADPGTTLVLDIGISGDTDKYADGIVLSADGDGVAWDSGTTAALQAATPARLSARTLVFATIPTSGASTVTNNTTVTFWVAYTL
jgi:membrane-bound inhibitor of C-type lysozyme